MIVLKIDQQRIKDRIAEIDKRLTYLRRAAEISNVKFLTNHQVFTSAERDLQIAIQACLDIASHLVVKINLEKPRKDNKEVFPILAKHKIIPAHLAEQLVKMAGQRNILVHEYLEVEREIIYHTIKYDLKDIIEFVKCIQKYLDKNLKIK